MLSIISRVRIPCGTPLEALYRKVAGDYPKFFKMDVLCRLGFLLSEMLVKDEPDRFVPRHDRAVLMFSRNGSYCNDRNYGDSLADFPSPALFVYTLPNIVTGEIAIRNKYAGETSAFVMEKFDPELFVRTVEEAFQDRETREAVVEWIDCRSEEDFEAFAFLVGRENGQYEFNKDNVIWKI